MMNEKNLKVASLMVAIFVGLTSIVNMSVTSYVLLDDRKTASMSPNSRERLNIAVEADLGRPSPLSYLMDRMENWFGTWYVGGSEATQATTGITISITGSNVASQATVNYYIEGESSDASGNPYRFLEGNGTSINVGGPTINPSNQTNIEDHLGAMGLSVTETHIVNYYVYVNADATGAMSGEALTSEIPKTLFDTVTYEYGNVIVETPPLKADYYIDTFDKQTTNDLIIKSANRHPSEDDWCGLGVRYNCSMIPQGVTIDEATWELTWKSDHESTMDAQYLGEMQEDIISHDVEWRNSFERSDTRINVTLPIADAFDSLNQDITSLVQEFVNQADWGTDKLHMELVLRDQEITDSDTNKDASFYDDGSLYTPVLEIQYLGYQASWYQIPPLSVVDIPITLEMGSVMVITVITIGILNDVKRRRNE